MSWHLFEPARSFRGKGDEREVVSTWNEREIANTLHTSSGDGTKAPVVVWVDDVGSALHIDQE